MQGLKFSKVKGAQHECKHTLLAIEDTKLKKVSGLGLVKNWSDAAKKQLEEKVKNFKPEEEAPFSSIQVHFENGSTTHILVLPPQISAFDLHSTLRSTLDDNFKTTSGDTYFVDTVSLKKNTERMLINGLASLAILSEWNHPKKTRKKTPTKSKSEKKTSEFFFATKLTPKELKAAVHTGSRIAESTNLVRTLAESPSNLLKPDQYRNLVKARAKERGYTFKFLDIKALEKLGAGAFLSVTKADPDDLGGIVHLTYRPKSSKKRVALVGKGVCFDTGGYNVKTGSYMYGMHRDMTGSAVALSLFEMLVDFKVPYEVHCFLALAENLISPYASRPNDLFYAANGTSIEMIDTDAEGRMLLADTLVMASREKPDLIIDFATLTGAAPYSIDTRRAAIFSNSNTLLQRGYKAGELSGERTWGFPIGDDYWKNLKSDIADIRQCSSASNADHIYAATFLSHFVEKGIDWIHMDLCTDTNKGGLGLVKTDVTGFGVRWAHELLNNYR